MLSEPGSHFPKRHQTSGLALDAAKLIHAKPKRPNANSSRHLLFHDILFDWSRVGHFKKLWEDGIGRLAAVYLVCLFGFIIGLPFRSLGCSFTA